MQLSNHSQSLFLSSFWSTWLPVSPWVFQLSEITGPSFVSLFNFQGPSLSILFSLSASLSSAWLSYHIRFRLSSAFFEIFLSSFLFKVSSFQKVYSPESLFRCFSLFWALSRALRYNTTPLPVCQRFFTFFCSFFSESRILCLSSSFSPRESSVSTLYNWDFPMV